MISDLEFRTRLLTESLQESIEPNYLTNTQKTLQKIVDKFSDRERLAGIVIYDNKNAIIISSQNLPKELVENQEFVANTMDADKENGIFTETQGIKYYLFVSPIHEERSVVGALLVIQKAQYIDARISEIWTNNILRLLVQALGFSLAATIIVRLIIFQPLTNFVQYIRAIRAGDKEISVSKNHSIFQPLTQEITSITQSLHLARMSASFEARMRLEKIDTPWTAERLSEFIKSYI